MRCISSVSLNGATTPFFKLGRGLRQGCPIFPLLFLSIVEGLSRLLKEVEINGSIKGVPIGVSCNITRLFFVDNILTFYEGARRVIDKFKGIIDLLCTTTGMVINMEKSMMTLWGISEQGKKRYYSVFFL